MEYDIIIIGAGPAGYTAAIRAGQLGMKTALIEKKHIGGMCLNWGCIPTKSLIESARALNQAKEAGQFGVHGIHPEKLSLDWKQACKRAEGIAGKMTGGIGWMLKKYGVEIITGSAHINGPGDITVGKQNLKTAHIIIATGSYPKKPEIPGLKDSWVQIEKLTELDDLPKEITIYGRGAVAVELAQFFKLAGSKVNMILSAGKLLPGFDDYLEKYVLESMQASGILIYSEKGISVQKGQLIASKKKIFSDIIINASWRAAIIPPHTPEIEKTKDGFLLTSESFETSVPGIYAIGDVNGKSYLAHMASAQGIWLINHIKGIRSGFNFRQYPLNLYANPEVAQIGQTEQELETDGIPFSVSEFPLSTNGKAMAEGQTEGLIRILAEDRYGQVMGVQIIARHATDMIAEASAFMQIEGTVYDVAQTIHAHPSVSEIFMEAGFQAVENARKKA